MQNNLPGSGSRSESSGSGVRVGVMGQLARLASVPHSLSFRLLSLGYALPAKLGALEAYAPLPNGLWCRSPMVGARVCFIEAADHGLPGPVSSLVV